jgi:hypothetical protein
MTDESRSGLVVRYGYLWTWEAKENRETGKDRPACLVTTLADGRVALLPITHKQPSADDVALLIPAPLKRQLGLDGEKSWIVLSECNVDIWPSYFASPTPLGDMIYGRLPEKFLTKLIHDFVILARSKKLRIIRRDL